MSAEQIAAAARPAEQIVNPYWDAVRKHAQPDRWFPGLSVGSTSDMSMWSQRFDHVERFAWTITAPQTVAFVAEYAGARMVDPLAGSGYWGFLLEQLGVDVACSDLAPPNTAENQWHRDGVVHMSVLQADAVDAVTVAGRERALLLSWPPHDRPIGAQIVDAYRGDRIIYIGEGPGGCCGTDDMFDAFENDWHEVAGHLPVQWFGLHDYVTVYDRNTVEER